MPEALTQKYKSLISLINSLDKSQIDVKVDNNILSIRGEVYSADQKNKLWDTYHQIDPNFISSDVDLDVKVTSRDILGKAEAKLGTDPINLRKGPGIEQPLVAELNDGQHVAILGRSTLNWWLVRMDDGREGYCYAESLTPIAE